MVEICRRLDGIPLALELAAARLRALPVEEIAARVNDRFRLLASGDRTALPRQKTLRALIDWSHDLLPEPERALLRRLAVFAGGFTLDAAEAVAAGGEIAAGDVLELLTGLVDKSLVTLDAEVGRYAMLETVRQYAMEKLDASGEGDPVRDRHLGYYLSLIEKADAGLSPPEEARWLERVDRARENILAAHAWSLRAPDACERSYRLVFAMRHHWFARGQLELGHRLSLDTIANGPHAPAGAGRGRALWVAGQISALTARYAEAQPLLEESLRIARSQRDRAMEARVLNVLALSLMGQGDSAGAAEQCERTLAIAREMGDERRIAMASNALAQIRRLEGDLARAEALYLDALASEPQARQSRDGVHRAPQSCDGCRLTRRRCTRRRPAAPGHRVRRGDEVAAGDAEPVRGRRGPGRVARRVGTRRTALRRRRAARRGNGLPSRSRGRRVPVPLDREDARRARRSASRRGASGRAVEYVVEVRQSTVATAAP